MGSLSVTAAKEILIGVGGLVAIAGIGFGYRAWRLSKITPEERERRRRAELVLRGKMGDATIIDIRDELIFYSYDVRGVEYTASQDLSLLHEYLPSDLSTLIGAVSVRYDSKIPANSIVLAEEWSGIRPHGHTEELKPQPTKVRTPK
jgi:hypothetical protein